MSSQAVLKALNSDPSVRRRIRFADAVFQIRVGDQAWSFAFRDGAIALAAAGAKPDVEVEIAPEAWAAFREKVPPPGCHDLYAMAETGRARLTGDYLTLFRYTYVLKDLVQQLATGRMFGCP